MTSNLVGLTGGIGSGKTLVGSFFAEFQVPLLEADDVSRALVTPGSPALDEIRRHFGSAVILDDGSLNRRLLRKQVFANEELRRELEAILHPRIRDAIVAWHAEQSAPYCVLSAAILIESGLRKLVRRVVVIDVPPELQLRRLTRRDSISEELAQAMMAAQISREERLQYADDVIDNSGSVEHARRQVHALHVRYSQLPAPG